MYDVVEVDTTTIYEIVCVYEKDVSNEGDLNLIIRGHKYDIPAQY